MPAINEAQFNELLSLGSEIKVLTNGSRSIRKSKKKKN